MKFLSSVTKRNSIIVVLSILALLISFIATQSTDGDGCPKCKCRHYVWMGLTLIGFGVIIVLLVGLIGVILFKVCVLARERKEDDAVDTKTANRLPYNVSFATREKKQPKGAQKDQQVDDPLAPQSILGCYFSLDRFIIFKAYKLLWNQALADFGASPSNESLDQIEALLKLGVSKTTDDDLPILQSTAHRFEKENKKLQPALEKIRSYTSQGASLKPIEHVCVNLYNTLFRLAHNRGEDVLQERIFIKDDENPTQTVTPFFMELLYPAIFRSSTRDEIVHFLRLLFNSSSEACKRGDNIIGFSSLSRDTELENTLRAEFPNLEELGQQVETRKQLEQQVEVIEADEEDQDQ